MCINPISIELAANPSHLRGSKAEISVPTIHYLFPLINTPIFILSPQLKAAGPMNELKNEPRMKGINLGASPEPFLPPQAAGY